MNIVVVGAGFSGTMVAVHLARQMRVRLSVTLIERTGRFGAGVAYATPFACHLLNVPAARMSAFPDDPHHFLRWASGQHPGVRPETFVSRQSYSAYLADILDDATTVAVAHGTTINRAASNVVSVTRRGTRRWRVESADGNVLEADAVVLAIGNYAPADPPCETPLFYDSPWYRQNPWSGDALTVDAEQDLLVLGTGLTMIDVAVALTDRGHRGRITCVSRRGLVPQAMRENATPPGAAPASQLSLPRTMRGLVREFRREVADRLENGGDWRDVVGSLRSATPSIWMSLPIAERRRFLRHVRPYWDTHRHGTAPAVARTIDALRERGRLQVLAGRVLGYEVIDGAVEARVLLRGRSAPERVRVQRVINCTGPNTNLTRVASPLPRDLHSRGMISPDLLGIGIATDDSGCVLDRNGAPQNGLYLVGPLRRGPTWEHLAVPELREGAARLAQYLTESLNGTPAR